MRTTVMAACLVALGIVGTGVARADDVLARCSAGTGERLRFIEDRLEERRPYAQYWWMGWTGFYGLGTIIQSVSAGL